MDNNKLIITQFKREFWENRGSFVRTPVIVSIIFLVLLSFGLLKVHGALQGDFHFDMKTTIANGNNKETKTEQWDGVDALAGQIKKDAGFFTKVVVGATTAHFYLQVIVFLVVLFGYAHNTLFDDRKNREILFWRSMPVSETTNVLVKLAFAICVVPLIIFALSLLASLVVFVVGVLFFAAEGLPLSGLVAGVFKDGALFTAFYFLPKSLLMMLALLPFIGFAFLCSAYAKKSPAVMGILVPILLILLDKVLGYVIGFTFHFGELLANYWRFVAYIGGDALTYSGFPLTNFIMALITGAAFVAVAIWLRNNRYEI